MAVEVLAEVHQVDGGRIDRDIDDHAATRPAVEQGSQHFTVVRLGKADLQELELALVEQRPVGVDRIDRDGKVTKAEVKEPAGVPCDLTV